MSFKRLGLLFSAVLLVSLMLIGVVSAASMAVTVTEGDVTRQLENTPPTDNWVLYTRAGTPPTAGAFVTGPASPPLGVGSLRLTTATSSEKVFLFNYDHVGKPLAGISEISYATYRTAGTGSQLPGLNMQVDFNGAAAGGFTTLVFEPIYNTAQGVVASGVWQTWNGYGSGRWWSTTAINGQCSGAATGCMRTWSQIVASNPDAFITGGFGINQGSGNPTLNAAVDALTLGVGGDTWIYNFEPDSDADGVSDGVDNCVNTPNADQADADNDGAGDACDTDIDGDGVANDDDNCASTPNAGQEDNDADGTGDVCDTDDDNDGVADEGDNCATTPNPGQEDADADGLGDICDSDDDNDGVADEEDNCATAANPGQEDNDTDGMGDACDPDDDNDGVNDGTDNCATMSNPGQEDNDADGAGDVCDSDDDNDGVTDEDDNCATVANPGQADNDTDGMGDACDADDDNDGVNDGTDNCATMPNSGQEDADGDGQGDVCDPDDDGDGIPDTAAPTHADQCKNGGWATFNNPSFKNQGQCIQYVNTGK
ncbi:MAG TPA: thrombospondin type 3 repeat-containing protein [Ardenticatenaceae bacterium]